MFKKWRGIKIPYKKQGLIFFTLLNYDNLARDLKCRIDELCRELGGEDCEALFEVLTTDSDVKTVEAIAREHYTSEKKLYSLRAEFYKRFERDLF